MVPDTSVPRIHRHYVVVEVAADNVPQPLSLFGWPCMRSHIFTLIILALPACDLAGFSS